MFENLQVFFESTQGQIATVILMLILFGLILIPNKHSKKNAEGSRTKTDVKSLAFSAVMVGIAIALSTITLFRMPQGGSVTPLSMLPIALIAYFFGTRRGVIAGICLGLLNLILSPFVIHPAQLLIDYPLAFGALGLGGFLKEQKHALIKVYIVGLLGRYLFAFISGAIFFSEYAPEGWNPIAWSLWYNATYLGVEGVITCVIILIPAVSKTFERLKSSL